MSLILLNSDFEVENTLTYSWNTYADVEKSLEYSWDILEYIEKVLEYSWTISEWIKNTLVYSWSVRNWVENTLVYSWNIIRSRSWSSMEDGAITFNFCAKKLKTKFYSIIRRSIYFD